MAQTCIHGTRNDDDVCVHCSSTAGEKLITLGALETGPKCPWCEAPCYEFNPEAFRQNHLSCQKTYQRGQQWAIKTIRKEQWLDCHSPYDAMNWLVEQIKKDTK